MCQFREIGWRKQEELDGMGVASETDGEDRRAWIEGKEGEIGEKASIVVACLLGRLFMEKVL